MPRGIIPATAKWLTAAIDLGKYLCHWIVVAWGPEAVGHIVDYGRIEVASEDVGVEKALLTALHQFRDEVRAGWPMGTAGGPRTPPRLVFVDSGYMAPVVYAFCRESGQTFYPTIGRGTSQQHAQWYNRPTSTGSIVKLIGEGYHVNLLPAEQLHLTEVDSDYWKSWVHQRLSTPVGKPGAMTLYQAMPQEHMALVKHLTAEVKTEEFIAGKGVVEKWERVRKNNHWLDALYNASAAGHACGVRLVPEPVPAPQPPRPPIQSHV